jgi:hypothetical protein
MNVKRSTTSNTFCGPAALSLLTGRHVDVCIREIRACSVYYKSTNRPVQDMSKNDMLLALDRMGYTINSAFHWDVSGLCKERGKKPTLVALMRWLKRQDSWSPKKKYLVWVTDHFMVMKGIKLFDNSNPDGVFFGKYDQRRSRVLQVWEVTKKRKLSMSRPVPSGSPRQLAASL